MTKNITKLKIVVCILLAILLFELGMLAYVIPGSQFLWITLGVILVVCIYLAGIIFGLLKELKEKDSKK